MDLQAPWWCLIDFTCRESNIGQILNSLWGKLIKWLTGWGAEPLEEDPGHKITAKQNPWCEEVIPAPARIKPAASFSCLYKPACEGQCACGHWRPAEAGQCKHKGMSTDHTLSPAPCSACEWLPGHLQIRNTRDHQDVCSYSSLRLMVPG